MDPFGYLFVDYDKSLCTHYSADFSGDYVFFYTIQASVNLELRAFSVVPRCATAGQAALRSSGRDAA